VLGFCYFNKIPELINFKKEKAYFGSVWEIAVHGQWALFLLSLRGAVHHGWNERRGSFSPHCSWKSKERERGRNQSP
jgi:hypothetical protein